MFVRLAVFILTIGLFGCQSNPEKIVGLDTQLQKVSYCIGLDIGKKCKQGSINVDMEALALGIKHALGDSAPRLTEQQIRETMQKFQEEMMAKQNPQNSQAGEKN